MNSTITLALAILSLSVAQTTGDLRKRAEDVLAQELGGEIQAVAESTPEAPTAECSTSEALRIEANVDPQAWSFDAYIRASRDREVSTSARKGFPNYGEAAQYLAKIAAAYRSEGWTINSAQINS